jgi:NADH-quinone oxidoreductase subunit L
VPLYVWLPDAMAGPTPVSALIHAATMVTAGVYMVCRMAPMYALAPVALTIIACVGAATAIFAATIGIAQNDIKKVLAYSTVSQLGYMFLAAGVGAFSAAIFHLMTHAFFKALLFLGSGAVIHALHHEQDMMKMGGLKKKLPVTYAIFLCGWVAIAGMPPTSGFFSKDEILWKSFLWSPIIWAVAALTALITAFYMTRLMGLTFWGKSRMDHHTEAHVHEVPGVMKWPLVTLAVLSIVGGFLNVPASLGGGEHLHHWLAPVFDASTYASGHAEAAVAEHGGAAESGHGEAAEGHDEAAGGHAGSAATEYGLMALAVALGAGMLWFGWNLYNNHPERAAAWRARYASIHKVLQNKYWVDELYQAVIIQPFYRLCAIAAWLDVKIVDGAVNAVRNVTVGTSYFSVFWDTWIVDGLVNLVGRVFRGSFSVLRRLQTGLTQSYASAMVFGIFVMICIYMYLS